MNTEERGEVRGMESAHKADLRPLLAVAAVVAVALTMWAAGAFAAGGSSSSDPAGSDPGGAYIQTQDHQARQGEDCPEDHGGRGGGSGNESDPSGSGAGNL
jgi:hypothetical protein